MINSPQNVEQDLLFRNLQDIGPIIETKVMGVIFQGEKVKKCVNMETLSKDWKNQWDIVIFEKEKLSGPNKLIMCADYPSNKISTKMLTQQRSNKMSNFVVTTQSSYQFMKKHIAKLHLDLNVDV